MDTDYQTITEPSNQSIWYSGFISNAISQNCDSSTLNRYKNKINLVNIQGTRVLEFIRKTQLYIEPANDDQYYFVDSSKRYRPDLISLEMYGTPILYWVILICNNLSHPLEVKTNMTLRIPQLSTILNNGRVI